MTSMAANVAPASSGTAAASKKSRRLAREGQAAVRQARSWVRRPWMRFAIASIVLVVLLANPPAARAGAPYRDGLFRDPRARTALFGPRPARAAGAPPLLGGEKRAPRPSARSAAVSTMAPENPDFHRRRNEHAAGRPTPADEQTRDGFLNTPRSDPPALRLRASHMPGRRPRRPRRPRRAVGYRGAARRAGPDHPRGGQRVLAAVRQCTRGERPQRGERRHYIRVDGTKVRRRRRRAAGQPRRRTAARRCDDDERADDAARRGARWQALIQIDGSAAATPRPTSG